MRAMADLHSAAGPEGSGAFEDGATVESVDVLAAHQSDDHVLAMYVEALNESPGTDMAVTVFSGGYAFSGRLVAASEYFDAVAEHADSEAIAIPFRQMAAGLPARPARRHADGDDLPPHARRHRLRRGQAPGQGEGVARPPLTGLRLDPRALRPKG